MVQATLQKEYGVVMKENASLKEDLRRLQASLSSAMDRAASCIMEKRSAQGCLYHEVPFHSSACSAVPLSQNSLPHCSG
jgi:hypothetical protein